MAIFEQGKHLRNAKGQFSLGPMKGRPLNYKIRRQLRAERTSRLRAVKLRASFRNSKLQTLRGGSIGR